MEKQLIYTLKFYREADGVRCQGELNQTARSADIVNAMRCAISAAREVAVHVGTSGGMTEEEVETFLASKGTERAIVASRIVPKKKERSL